MKEKAARILPAVLGVLFIAAGAIKFSTLEGSGATFTEFGFPAWMRFVIGGAEIAGGVGLFIPITRRLAGLGLAVIMAGAVFLHLRHGQVAEVMPAAVLLALLIVALILLGRKDTEEEGA